MCYLNFVSNKQVSSRVEMCGIAENWSKCKFRYTEFRIIIEISFSYIKSKKNLKLVTHV